MSDTPTPPETPIIVPATAANDQLASAGRSALIYFAGWLSAKNFLPAGAAEVLVPLVLAGAPFLWAQVSILRKQKRALIMAQALDNSIAQVKS